MKQLNESLHKNSLFLIANTLGTSGLGLVFWILIAKLYPSDEVGIGSAIISTMTFFVGISNLGFSVGLIRFLPTLDERDSKDLINSCFLISGLLSIVFSIIFILGLAIWSPKLAFLRNDYLFIVSFIIFCVIGSLTAHLGSVFIANKSAKYVFIKDTGIFSILKLILPIMFVTFGAVGILFSWGVSWLFAFLVSIFFILPKVQSRYTISFNFRNKIVKNMIHFSFGNHVGDMFRFLPGLLLPIILIDILAPEFAAYFYIAWMISNILFMIPISSTTSLLVENSSKATMCRIDFLKSFQFTLTLVTISILAIFCCGDVILGLVGPDYANNAVGILRMFALSCIPLTLIALYVTIKRIEKKVASIIMIYGSTSLITFVMTFLLINKHGLDSIGYAWLSAQTIVCIFILPLLIKEIKGMN